MYLTASSVKRESISLVTSLHNVCQTKQIENTFMYCFPFSNFPGKYFLESLLCFVDTPNLMDECISSLGEFFILLVSKSRNYNPVYLG